MGELKVRNFIRIDDHDPVPFDSLSPAEQKKIGILLNARALASAGYIPDQKQMDAALRNAEMGIKG